MAQGIDLSGRHALVTGGGAGIGRAIALAFAECGARVTVAEMLPDRCDAIRAALAERGEGHVVVQADVREAGDLDVLFDRIGRDVGSLDILVNNVGDNLKLRGAFEDFREEDWDALYAVNLRQMFAVTRRALPLLRQGARGGSIVNLSTIEAYRGAPPAAVYSAFKTAITGFTRSLALELAPEGIRVNIIAPETTATAQVPVHDLIRPEHRGHIDRWIPLGRFGTPEDIAGCVLFLASDLSAWVTGTTIHADGGALAAGGFYRAPDGRWTNFPVVSDVGIEWIRSGSDPI